MKPVAGNLSKFINFSIGQYLFSIPAKCPSQIFEAPLRFQKYRKSSLMKIISTFHKQ
ncbi:hypothetical protein HMPREF1349_02999 [Enterococcus faecium 506]|nr:hypothetical protein HMPREF1349_02999 [Enterococcus faecium 506]MBK4850472.1 hypothetical protein [Enterococcus faecium]